jgi:hypothetical protein
MLNSDQMIRRELLDDPFAGEAADPAVLFPAERIVGSVIGAHVVDVLQLQGKTQPSRFVSCEYGARQTILRVICNMQCLCLSIDADEWNDLLSLCEVGTVPNFEENLRRKNQAMRLTTEDLLDTAATRLLDAMQHAVKLPFVDNRSGSSFGIIRISVLQASDALDEFVSELVVDLRVDDNSIDAHTDLALMQEAPDDRGPDRLIHIGIIQYNKGRVAAEFERDLLQMVAVRCQGSDVLAYRVEPVNEMKRGTE